MAKAKRPTPRKGKRYRVTNGSIVIDAVTGIEMCYAADLMVSLRNKKARVICRALNAHTEGR